MPKYEELTNIVYSLIEFFPEDELLKQKIKGRALDVLESLTIVFSLDDPNQDVGQKAKSAKEALKDIEVLKSYLTLAKERDWIDSVNLMILCKEYDRIKEDILPIAKLVFKEEITPVDNVVNKEKLSPRQSKILEILKTQEKVQVSDLQKALSNVSKRTLRRDLDELLKAGKVERSGEFNQVVYKLVGEKVK